VPTCVIESLSYYTKTLGMTGTRGKYYIIFTTTLYLVLHYNLVLHYI